MVTANRRPGCPPLGEKRTDKQHSPDHNTLCRAANYLRRTFRANKLLDVLGEWAAEAKRLKLAEKPLAVDSTAYESHHVSRHYEQRCRQTRNRTRGEGRKPGGKSGRSRTVKGLPDLGIAVATGFGFAGAWIETTSNCGRYLKGAAPPPSRGAWIIAQMAHTE